MATSGTESASPGRALAAGAQAEAEALAVAGRADAALERLWPLLADAPDDPGLKVLAARQLARVALPVDPARAPLLRTLLTAPEVDPIPVARAGWRLAEAAAWLPSADEAGARRLETDALLLALLAETSVAHPAAELALTALRRWLLLSGRATDFPKATRALVAQATRNGGAWPFDAAERARLEAPDAAVLAEAYRPPRPQPMAAGAFASPVTRAVAGQYEAWPYPVWERVMKAQGETLNEIVAALGPDAPTLPDAPEILVAGCGSGRETLLIARLAPRARITAIDISAASLACAAERCADADNIVFEQGDLHGIGASGRRFDLVSCSGVLHHLPDPEAGWAALVTALKPGGLMSVMVYSKLARMRVQAARRRIRDLMDRPVDDDLLREIRRRLLADPPHALAEVPDFASMGGVYDLLLHRHEDPFDVARIRAGIERLNLVLLGYHLPGTARRARHRVEHPDDPWFRDYDAWAAAEWREPGLFAGMYRFWCRKPPV